MSTKIGEFAEEIPFVDHIHEVVLSELLDKGWTITETGRRFNRANGKLVDVRPCVYLSLEVNPAYEWAQFGEIVIRQPESDKAQYRVREISIIHLRLVKSFMMDSVPEQSG